MGNIISYLRWRGDLSLEQYPFNEVDNLVLSTLAYVNLTDVVPVQEQGTSVTLREAAEIYFEKHDDAELASLKSTFIAPPILLKDIAATNRFCNARLSEFSDCSCAENGSGILGLFFLCVPEFALRVLGMEFFAVIFCFAAYKLIRYGIIWRKKQPVKLYRVILFSLAAIMALIFLTEATVLSVSESFILGVLLAANAYMVFVRTVKGIKKGDRFWPFDAVSSIISLLLGIVSFVTMDSRMAGYITYVGLYLLATGTSEIAVSIYNNIQNNDEQ